MIVYKKSSNDLLYFHWINICVRDIYSSLMHMSWIFYLINAYVRYTYLSLIQSRQNYTLAFPLNKRTRLVSYKYLMNPSSSRFTISILCYTHTHTQIYIYIYIYSKAFLSKISLHSLSKKILTWAYKSPQIYQRKPFADINM
jgi:hypothetical protein